MQPFDANQPNEARVFGVAPSGKVKQGPHLPPAILNTSPTPATLFRALQRRLVQAVVFGLMIAAGAAAAAYYFAPEPKHEVRMLISVPAPAPEFIHTNEKFADTASFQRNQIVRAKSRLVLGKALKDTKVAKLPSIEEKIEPLEWLESEVFVDFSVAPEVMKISMRGLNTDELLVLVPAIYTAYETEVGPERVKEREERQKHLVKMIDAVESKLKFRRKTLQDDQENLTSSSNPVVRAAMLAYRQQVLTGTQQDLARAKSALNQASASLRDLETNQKVKPKAEIRESDILREMSLSLELGEFRTGIDALEKLKTGIESRSVKGKQAAEYISAENRVKKLKKELAEAETRVRAAAIKRLEERADADVRTTIVLLKQEVVRQQTAVDLLTKDEKLAMALLTAEAQSSDKADLIKEEINALEKTLATLRSQESALELDLKTPSKNKVLEPPTIIHVNGEKRKIILASGVGGGVFLFCLFGLAFLEYRTRKVASVDDVVLGLGMRLVGTVPNARKAKASKTYAATGKKIPSVAQQVLTESIDAARTTLLHLARSHSLRTVMVTSAVAGEGKTSLSCHLAASLARAGLRVLLVDGDMRNPSAHKLFNMPFEVGFSEVLCDKADLIACIQKTPLRNLALLPAGHWSDQTAAALNQGKAAVAFAQLRDDFDIIVVDSSPVLPVADALLLGQQVDAVILSVLCEVSRLNNLYAAWMRVQDHGGQPLGVVINGVWGSTYGSTYHYPYPRKPAKVKA